MFKLANVQAVSYRELWDIIPAAVVVKGQAAIVQDMFGFYFKGTESTTAGEEITFVYWADMVWADKEVGSGQEIYAGQEVYYNVSSGLVTASPTGTIGTDYYFCGIAKRDALANDDQVIIEFIGDEWNHADRDNTQA
jgi:hypothetical protein